jgi:hypothetical protein
MDCVSRFPRSHNTAVNLSTDVFRQLVRLVQSTDPIEHQLPSFPKRRGRLMCFVAGGAFFSGLKESQGTVESGIVPRTGSCWRGLAA